MKANPEGQPITEKDLELDALLSKAIRVKVRVAKNLSHVQSVRISSQELREFSAAAEARGMTLSDFMRGATRAAIAGDLDVERAAVLGKVREKARELADAVSRL